MDSMQMGDVCNGGSREPHDRRVRIVRLSTGIMQIIPSVLYGLDDNGHCMVIRRGFSM